MIIHILRILYKLLRNKLLCTSCKILFKNQIESIRFIFVSTAKRQIGIWWRKEKKVCLPGIYLEKWAPRRISQIDNRECYFLSYHQYQNIWLFRVKLKSLLHFCLQGKESCCVKKMLLILFIEINYYNYSMEKALHRIKRTYVIFFSHKIVGVQWDAL